MPLEISEASDGLIFPILVQPRASKNEAVGLHAGALKVRLTAPPVEGKANKMCAAFLAKALGVPKSAVEIVSGHTGRNKKMKVACTEAERGDLRRRISALAG